MAILGKGVIQLVADATGAIRGLQAVKSQASMAAQATTRIGDAAQRAFRPMSALKQVMLHAAGYALGQFAVAGIQNMVREAVGAVATFERMEMSLTALTAKEVKAANDAEAFAQIMRDQLGATDAQVMRYQRLRSEYERVTQAIQRMTAKGQTQSEYFQRLVDYQRELRHQIKVIVPGYDKLSTALQRAATGEMTMAEALKEAGPRAQELFRWTQKLAIQSPFSAEGVMNALRTAMAYGFTTKQAQQLTQVMIDFASATGASEGVMNQVALALGQIKAKGKLAGQEILQLVNAGVPVNDILSQMGYSLDDVSKGLVNAQDFMDAFTQYMNENFGGAAKRQAESFAGLLNTFQDLKKQGLAAFFEGAFQALKPLLVGLADWLQGPGLDRLQEWGRRLGDIVNGFLFISGAVKALVTGDIGRLSGLFQKMGVPREVQQNIFRFVTQVPRKLTEFRDWIAGIVDEVRAKVGPWAEETFGRIVAWFEENGPTLRAAAENLASWIGTAFSWLASQIGPALDIILPLLSGLVDVVLGAVQTIARLVTGDWAGAWESFKGIVSAALDAVWSALTALFDMVLGWMGSSWPEFVAMWQGIWDQVQFIVSHWKEVVVLLWQGYWNWLTGLLRSMWSRVTALWQGAQRALLGKVARWIADLYWKWQGMKEDLKSTLQQMVQAVQEKAQAMYRRGADLIQGLWDGLKSKIQAVIDWLEEKMRLILSIIDKIHGISSPSRKMAERGRWLMEGLAQGLTQGWRKVRGQWSLYARMPGWQTPEGALQRVVQHEVKAPVNGGKGFQIVQVHLHYAPTFSLADEVEMERVLGPFVLEKVREALGGGVAWAPG